MIFKLFLKEKSTNIFFLSLIFSTIFWFFYDINSRLASDGTYGKGISDLNRYYQYYQVITFDGLKTIRWYQGKLFYSFFYFLNLIGFNFKLLLFISVNLYFISFAHLARIFLKTENIYIILIIYCTLLFWLNSSMGVALRQGFAMLLIALFLDVLFRKKSYMLKSLYIFLLINTHFSAIILVPLVIFWSKVKKHLRLLNGLFLISLVLYVAELWYFFSSEVVLFLTKRDIPIGALGEVNSDYKLGFSIYKMAAFLFPIVFYNATKFFGYRHNSESLVLYVLFVYYSIVGMIFSGFPYHDRLFLYGWIFSPLLIASFFKIFLKEK